MIIIEFTLLSTAALQYFFCAFCVKSSNNGQFAPPRHVPLRVFSITLKIHTINKQPHARLQYKQTQLSICTLNCYGNKTVRGLRDSSCTINNCVVVKSLFIDRASALKQAKLHTLANQSISSTEVLVSSKINGRK